MEVLSSKDLKPLLMITEKAKDLIFRIVSDHKTPDEGNFIQNEQNMDLNQFYLFLITFPIQHKAIFFRQKCF